MLPPISPNNDYFLSTPDDASKLIFDYLDPRSLYALARSSKKIKRLVEPMLKGYLRVIVKLFIATFEELQHVYPVKEEEYGLFDRAKKAYYDPELFKKEFPLQDFNRKNPLAGQILYDLRQRKGLISQMQYIMQRIASHNDVLALIQLPSSVLETKFRDVMYKTPVMKSFMFLDESNFQEKVVSSACSLVKKLIIAREVFQNNDFTTCLLKVAFTVSIDQMTICSDFATLSPECSIDRKFLPFSMVVDILYQFRSLRRLTIATIGLTDSDLAAFLRIVENSKRSLLGSCILYQNNFTNEGLKHLAKCLNDHKSFYVEFRYRTSENIAEGLLLLDNLDNCNIRKTMTMI